MRRGQQRSPGWAAGATGRCNRAAAAAQHLRAEGSEPARASWCSPARPGPITRRPQLSPAAPLPAAHTVLLGSRGGRPLSPRCFAFRFLLQRVGSPPRPRPAPLITEAERPLPARSPRTARRPPPPPQAPRRRPFTPPRRHRRRGQRPVALPALPRLTSYKPPSDRCRARNPAARRRTKSSAAGGRSPHFPQPARARTRAPALPIPNALEFQSYFRAPGRQTTPAQPLSSHRRAY